MYHRISDCDFLVIKLNKMAPMYERCTRYLNANVNETVTFMLVIHTLVMIENQMAPI